ncbi:MAG: hypothetical protein V7631_57 [Massilia sp.]|jgi:hypothetical protein
MRQLRALLVDEKSAPREAMRVSAYRKRGETGHHEKLE